ncbi:hypothetical protein UFOVP853_45 [uncultured Caudovirales phage]|uniref:VRR-NUC domain containing protein n=1 Tax=uncultured Caudovirales phage TaxID=2100421 RepID=A0A6J5PBK3_9CAUD|nr:hypothetical protein UFOVP853_45 [uncultured Caudovirales phage]
MRHAEHHLQTAAYAYLRKALPPEAMVWSTDHAGKRSVAAGARMKQRGIIPGISDMFVFHKRLLIGLELKAGSNGATDAQNAFGGGVVENGGLFAVVRSLEEIERTLRQAGIPLRATMLTAVERDALLAAPTAPRESKPRTQKPSAARVRKVQAVFARVGRP